MGSGAVSAATLVPSELEHLVHPERAGVHGASTPHANNPETIHGHRETIWVRLFCDDSICAKKRVDPLADARDAKHFLQSTAE